jgi:PadR family transcriptional regulator
MGSSFYENWVTQLRKGMLSFCVLRALNRQRMYGYDLVKTLGEIEGLVISEGTIYPLLSRLRKEGLVRTQLQESSSGPPRKYYELTARGTLLLDEMTAHWKQSVDGLDALK